MQYFFLDEGHIYFDENGHKQLSVSHFVDKYKDKFTGKQTAIKRAFRDIHEDFYKAAKKIHPWDSEELFPFIMDFFIPLLSDDVKEQLFKEAERYDTEWGQKGSISSEDGTERHTEEEIKAMETGFLINYITGKKHKVVPRPTGLGYDNKYIIEDVLQEYKEDIVMLECMIGDPNAGIFGQSDKVFFSYLGSGQWSAVVGDYKTDKEITSSSFFDGKKYRKLKGVLNYFMDCKLHYYAIKMSFYAYFLERIEVKVTNMYLESIKKGEPTTYYNLGIYINYVKKMIEENKNLHHI